MLKKLIISVSFLIVLLAVVTGVAAQDEYNGYIVKFKDSYSSRSIAALCEAESKNFDIECVSDKLNLYKTEDASYANDLKNSDIVEYVQPNYYAYLADYTVNDSYYKNTSKNYNWPQKMVCCPKAWNMGCFGDGVKICVIDSGIAVENQAIGIPNNFYDFNGNVSSGYNYLNNTFDVTDDTGHGTCVTQIIASQNNSDYFIGVAPRAEIIPQKAFAKNVDTTIDILIDAIVDAVEYFNCDIINMSWVTSDNPALHAAIDYAAENGVLMVASVGNDGKSTIKYPAGYDNVIGVGSINNSFARSEFSQYNTSVFCAAPGEGIYAYTINKDTNIWNFALVDGTSFSAPMVTGMTALLKNIEPSLTLTQLKDIIMNTSIDLGSEGYDTYYGYGMVNVENAINHLLASNATFVSDIYNFDDSTNITVTNNTPEPKTYTSIWNSNSAQKIKLDTYTIGSFKSVTIAYPFDGTFLKHILVNSKEDLKPLYESKNLVIESQGETVK